MELVVAQRVARGGAAAAEAVAAAAALRRWRRCPPRASLPVGSPPTLA